MTISVCKQQLPGESRRDFTQRRTFLAWINNVLATSGNSTINDPILDLKDGIVLAQLITAITGKKLKGIDDKAKTNKMKCISNLNICFDAMKGKRISDSFFSLLRYLFLLLQCVYPLFIISPPLLFLFFKVSLCLKCLS